jgi:hypothetical protein
METSRVQLLGDFAWGFAPPRIDARFKNFELGIGPINAGVYLQEIAAHDVNRSSVGESAHTCAQDRAHGFGCAAVNNRLSLKER